MSLSVAQTVLRRMIKDVEGGISGIMKVISRYFVRESERNHKNFSRNSGLCPEI